MLKFKRDNLDGLTDEQKALYTEKDGVYILQVEGLPEGENVDGLKSTLEKLKRGKQSMEDQIAELTKAAEGATGGLPQDKFDQLLSALKSSEHTEAVEHLKAGRVEQAMEILGRDQRASIKSLEEKLETSNGELDKLKGTNRDLQLATAFDKMSAANTKFLGHGEHGQTARADLMNVFKSEMVITEHGIYQRDPANKENILVKEGNKVDSKLWFEDQVKQRPHLFSGTKGIDVGGAPGSGGEEFSLENVNVHNMLNKLHP